MPDDHEALFDALAAGLSAEKAAEQFCMPVEKVRELLKAEIERCLSGEHLRAAWMLADRRLEAVEHKFFNKAIKGDGDSVIIGCPYAHSPLLSVASTANAVAASGRITNRYDPRDPRSRSPRRKNQPAYLYLTEPVTRPAAS